MGVVADRGRFPIRCFGVDRYALREPRNTEPIYQDPYKKQLPEDASIHVQWLAEEEPGPGPDCSP